MSEFESAVEAIVGGDAAALQRLLRDHPDLVRARSTREHHATLLHYVGSNGVEQERQRTPQNIVEIARILLDAGADIHAMADIYRGSDTFGLAATSCHPRDAGVLIPLLEFLLSRGATFDVHLVHACHANGRPEAAQFLVALLGDDALDLEAAAGVGRLEVAKARMAGASDRDKRAALAWAAEYGWTDVALYLVDHGVPIDARVPPHDGTALHWAAYQGHLELVNALLSRGAPLDVRDKSFDGTPLDWAEHAGQAEVAAALRRHQG